eukprot:CAMPEP_0183367148 /NCGR_PEP_ID=MMETSP0164_2-20130417/91479_1 /TAXON_ID=221442 /ORGANISM="Coccolithus pelagicus ssp braarudi, Strain PLY182g" /LENGTH=98 /DNA_ID=CAMNT_0025543045 /DNA_START=211 /DNA_END=504 /DNA_ORIENTATION=+
MRTPHLWFSTSVGSQPSSKLPGHDGEARCVERRRLRAAWLGASGKGGLRQCRFAESLQRLSNNARVQARRTNPSALATQAIGGSSSSGGGGGGVALVV